MKKIKTKKKEKKTKPRTSAPGVGEHYDGCKREYCTCAGSESTYCLMEQAHER
jgi:hypothetical protein